MQRLEQSHSVDIFGRYFVDSDSTAFTLRHDNKSSVEIYSEELQCCCTGLTPPEMVVPKLANITAAAPPFASPEFRGLLLVGDVSTDSNKPHSQDTAMPGPTGVAPEINFGYLPVAAKTETERELTSSASSQKALLQRLGIQRR